MKTFFKKYGPVILIFLACLFFLPSLFTFFSGDDWAHLALAQISTPKELLNFFDFRYNQQSASFYRPLPSQFFFFIFYRLFGLSAFYYHLFTLSVFALTLYIIYKLYLSITKSKHLAITSLFFYAFSATHFTRLYFLSAFQEICMTFFILLSLWKYRQPSSLKNTIISITFFTMALASKETAVIFPIILVLFDLLIKKKLSKKIIPYLVVQVIYLCLRFFLFGFHEIQAQDGYGFSLSPQKALNTLTWYSLWSLGAPELLISRIGSGFKVLPVFFVEYSKLAYLLLTTIIISIGLTVNLVISSIKKISSQHLLAAGIFIISLLPVLFFPHHKFTLELSLPLVGFSLLLGLLLKNKNRCFSYIFIAVFIILNTISVTMAKSADTNIIRGNISKKLYLYLKDNYPTQPVSHYFFFKNAIEGGKYVSQWGSSKQIAFVSSFNNFFKVFYQDKNAKVFYEDYPANLPEEHQPIIFNTSYFLQ
ncbi:glycosyltransferase family 39 protein [Candidatus Microgenomates bacterium]|nr:glycosyltransferase family 39 protein [Candidatus Microgenomates bacterium]